MLVNRFISKYHGSNTYVIDFHRDEVIVIDPGDPDISSITDWLESKNKSIKVVILTHEHADHCAGVNALIELGKFKLICSGSCADNISDSRQNMSAYVQVIEKFEVKTKCFLVKDNSELTFFGRSFRFYETPGHSPGSICIFTPGAVFTGDTLMRDYKTPLSFPHSDKNEYTKSILRLSHLIKKESTVYSGHGNPFIFSNDIIKNN